MPAFRSAAVLAVATAASYQERRSIYRALTRLIAPRHVYIFSPGEATMNRVRIAALSGILLSLPIVAHLVCAYLRPNTGARDPMLLAVPVLCLPALLSVVTASRDHLVHSLPRAKDHVDLTMGTLIASALAFAAPGALALRRAA